MKTFNRTVLVLMTFGSLISTSAFAIIRDCGSTWTTTNSSSGTNWTCKCVCKGGATGCNVKDVIGERPIAEPHGTNTGTLLIREKFTGKVR